MNTHGAAPTRSRVVAILAAVITTLALTVLPVATAAAATTAGSTPATATSTPASTGSTPVLVCPPGTTDPTYCSDYCPAGTLVTGLCVTTATPTPSTTAVSATTATISGKTVLPQGMPEAYHWRLWGAKLDVYTGPALKFKLRSGINGAPYLKSFRLLLPAGLTFVRPALGIGISAGVDRLSSTARTLTVGLRGRLPALAIYIKNHSLIESSQLRQELAASSVRTLTFKLEVTNAAGVRTVLTFDVTPRG